MIKARKDRVRFESMFKINKNTECWEWDASLTKGGYGQFTMQVLNKNNNILAHRASYSLYKTFIPDGLLVCHRCDNPLCVNLAHLFLGTHQDNHDDIIKKDRASWQKRRLLAEKRENLIKEEK